ncbi:flagellar motor switch protein FliM [Cohaesibacter celericrescens]|uniref:Flagellar motor switch protein FliM n=1 Tax=Cohaesibacter celericrescens TaxID=2067669 RepID=A0A2N5XWW2_9HYPH|nr:FliM/FliN family flagellar motor switch protein [Cohaesibacter celericrescens]PLW75501.1 flagellar motor switch protein FliM [Cohaesibacter celericrescens]PLW78908.1 flagellar motor switch protein FliM [Cohaesibacter celericrescens]
MMQSHHSPITDRLLDAAGTSIERLPMLPIIFDRMARVFADTMRQRAASPCYVSVSYIGNDRIGDVLDANEANALAAVVYTPEWDTRLLIGFDRDFIFSMMEVMYGSDGSEPPIDDERPFSNIETRVARSLFNDAIKCLEDAFKSISDITLKFERIETRMDFAVIGRRNNTAVVGRLLMQAIGRGGEMFVMVPHTALTPLRQNLAQVVSGEGNHRDKGWTQQFQAEIQRTHVDLEAVLEEKSITLDELANLKVGDVLQLQATPRSKITLQCNDQSLFTCSIGQADGSYCLKVDDFIHQEEDIFDDILSS